MNQIKRGIEVIVFTSRWLLAPFLLGLIVGLAALLAKFILKLVDFVMQMRATAPADVILGILNLVDLTLRQPDRHRDLLELRELPRTD